MAKWYWVSWVELSADYRPLTSPPNESIIGWWKSGESADGFAMLCALVKEVEAGHNPGLGGRFVLSDWALERYREAFNA